MKCQILFSGKNKNNNIILSSAENTQRVVKVKLLSQKNIPCEILYNFKSKNACLQNDIELSKGNYIAQSMAHHRKIPTLGTNVAYSVTDG